MELNGCSEKPCVEIPGMWNAMIAGYGIDGHGREASELANMERLNIKPNEITFTGALHAYSHVGLVAEGKTLFGRMINDFRMIPKVEHYGCMVDLPGRAGQLDEACEMIESMPMTPNAS